MIIGWQPEEVATDLDELTAMYLEKVDITEELTDNIFHNFHNTTSNVSSKKKK